MITKKKEAFEGASIMRFIRRDFEAVVEAREAGATWAEIAEIFGFQGKSAAARYAFFYERRRREKKGETPTKTKPVHQKIENGKQKSERKVHMILDGEEDKTVNQFEQSKLY